MVPRTLEINGDGDQQHREEFCTGTLCEQKRLRSCCLATTMVIGAFDDAKKKRLK